MFEIENIKELRLELKHAKWMRNWYSIYKHTATEKYILWRDKYAYLLLTASLYKLLLKK